MHAAIDESAANGVPNIITFSGNRRGMADAEGADNCVAFLNKVKAQAEDKGITICMEYLNSKVNHKDYMFDHIAWGVDVMKRVNSPRVKILFDIYHAQIMDGDIVRNIRDHFQWIGHFHTGGNPGRHEIDEIAGAQLSLRHAGHRGSGLHRIREPRVLAITRKRSRSDSGKGDRDMRRLMCGDRRSRAFQPDASGAGWSLRAAESGRGGRQTRQRCLHAILHQLPWSRGQGDGDGAGSDPLSADSSGSLRQRTWSGAEASPGAQCRSHAGPGDRPQLIFLKQQVEATARNRSPATPPNVLTGDAQSRTRVFRRRRRVFKMPLGYRRSCRSGTALRTDRSSAAFSCFRAHETTDSDGNACYPDRQLPVRLSRSTTSISRSRMPRVNIMRGRAVRICASKSTTRCGGIMKCWTDYTDQDIHNVVRYLESLK